MTCHLLLPYNATLATLVALSVVLARSEPGIAIASAQDFSTADFWAEAELAQGSIGTGDGLDPLPDAGNIPSDLGSDIEAEDLGEIRIVPPSSTAPAPGPPPMAQLLLQTSASANTNITGLSDPSLGGYPLGAGVTLLLTPSLGPSTRVVASAGAGLTRFPGNGDSDYNALDFSVGVEQRLTPEMYGRLDWDNRQLYRAGSGENLGSTNAVNLILGRQDRFSDQWRLDSFYSLQMRFVSPNEFTRLTNTLGANVRVALTPQVEGWVGYELALENYTQVVRFDTTHRLRAGLNYRPLENFYLSGAASYLFGSSSASSVSLDNLSIGFSAGFNVSLF